MELASVCAGATFPQLVAMGAVRALGYALGALGAGAAVLTAAVAVGVVSGQIRFGRARRTGR
jgi:hypothetical protein